MQANRQQNETKANRKQNGVKLTTSKPNRANSANCFFSVHEVEYQQCEGY